MGAGSAHPPLRKVWGSPQGEEVALGQTEKDGTEEPDPPPADAEQMGFRQASQQRPGRGHPGCSPPARPCPLQPGQPKLGKGSFVLRSCSWDEDTKHSQGSRPWLPSAGHAQCTRTHAHSHTGTPMCKHSHAHPLTPTHSQAPDPRLVLCAGGAALGQQPPLQARGPASPQSPVRVGLRVAALQEGSLGTAPPQPWLWPPEPLLRVPSPMGPGDCAPVGRVVSDSCP